MQVIKKPFADVRQFSARDVAYTLQDDSLKPFYSYSPDLSGFATAIEDRSKFTVNRSLLVEVLNAQYSNREHKELANNQIKSLLNDSTFTVITAHQPALFTGPLYYIYKIACTIQLSRQLKKAFPAYNFVPVFVSGGEDHDFEEINHLNVFAKSLTWEQEKKGSVGRLYTDSLEPVIEELSIILGERAEAKEIMAIIRRCYGKGKLYGKSTLDFVHELFGNEGIVALSMDEPKLKSAFKSVMSRELFEQPSAALIEGTQSRIMAAGYKEQAYAREINLFYLGNGYRERIEKSDDGNYLVLNTALVFSPIEMKKELDEYPERFSPNVVMRPMYQEFSLPNLAYIGGGGELAYWLERKDQFEHFKIFYPLLLRRNSALWIDKGSQKRMKQFDLNVDDLFDDQDTLVKNFISKNSQIDLSFGEEKIAVEVALDKIVEKAKKIDPTLAKSLEAEKIKMLKNVEQMGGRLIRSEKQKQEQQLKQIVNLQDKLFPGNGLQERHDNFLSLYLSQGKQLIPQLIEWLNPLDNRMVIFVED